MTIRIVKALVVISLTILFIGCMKSEYEKKVEKELAKGVRFDSLFLGIRFGMTENEFFQHCWDYNKKGIFMESNFYGTTTVSYKFKDDFKYPVTMDFYPELENDKIIEVMVAFKYDSWAPWNKPLFAANLEKEVLSLYEKWYGKGFIKITHPKRVDLFVKVDGNRRIRIFEHNNTYVRASFTDLLAERELKEKVSK